MSEYEYPSQAPECDAKMNKKDFFKAKKAFEKANYRLFGLTLTVSGM